MAESKSTRADTQTERPKANGQPKRQPRVISSLKDVAQLVMMKIDQVNAKKDELTITVKGLADTAKQLVRAGERSVREVGVNLKLCLTLFVRADIHWKLNWQIIPQGSCNFGLTDSLANTDGLKAFASTAVAEDSTLWLKDAANAAEWRL